MKIPIQGILYPFAVDPGLGALAQETSYDQYVEQLIKQVLFTNPGERINRPDFGCGLRRLVFAPNNEALASLTKVMIVQSLQKWLDDMIEVQDVKVKSEQEVLEVKILYRLKALGKPKILNVEL